MQNSTEIYTVVDTSLWSILPKSGETYNRQTEPKHFIPISQLKRPNGVVQTCNSSIQHKDLGLKLYQGFRFVFPHSSLTHFPNAFAFLNYALQTSEPCVAVTFSKALI